ncbi:S41 family peptidase [Cyclobacterium amurskyense]|uniref:Periplasmic protease n=1 Tax=Cyclobacterium amurskyense TaxID=320787 RepID=A0A0H4P9P0_9BACT|nr:S41 family peptidase [Cyclobacterium amurskyense]AKP51211.1 Periplasmic protease [Cyclobacterium amurskyense]
MKNFIVFLFLLAAYYCQAQNDGKFNFDFESQKDKSSLSDGWFKWGDYNLSIDSLTYSGKNAVKITATDTGKFGCIAYPIPAIYSGKTLRLEGYMKIKNVTNGFAGLLLRIDGKEGILAFANMDDQKIKGTKDWQKYSITVNYPQKSETIYVAGILSGKGEAWFDDFYLTLDGENIETLTEAEIEEPKAILDTAFDKGSLLDLSVLTAEKTDDLELLGRVWGFLKYHHPEIAKGNYNWDYELFRFLPSYIEAKNEADRNKLIIDWIDSLNPLTNCTDCIPTDENAILKPDLTWIQNQDSALKDKLLSVYNNRSQGRHYYIQMTPSVGNPDFINENSYENMPYPDDGFRLLSLFRYWNMINYFFPYKHLMDSDWNIKLKEYIPVFLDTENELEYELAALQLIGDIQDTHANIWGGGDKINAWKGSNFPPVNLRFIEDKLVVADFYNEEHIENTGLKVGDIITKINGRPIKEIVNEKSKYYPASNEAARLRNISIDILRSNDDEVKIDFISEGAKENATSLKLYPKDSLDYFTWFRKNYNKSYRKLENDIGYVTLATIKQEDIENIKKDFKNSKGIIIDIRNYPSTFVPFSLGSFFVSSSTPFVKFTIGNINNPGEFSFTKNLEIPSTGKSYKGKLVVLINEFSQSQAEYTAMAFRAGDNTTVIGSTTAGADGNVSSLFLPGGLKTMISGIGVYYPNREETQRIGIVPDIEVKPTIEGIKAGRDELLERAIEIISED